MIHLDERAVSEVIAFILVFSIIIMSVGVVYTFGFSGIQTFSQSELDRNAEQAMDALALHLADLHQGPTPERSGELALRGETLSITEGTTVSVNVRQDTGWENHTYQLGALTFETGQSSISYEGGAVIRHQGGNSVLLTEPALICSERNGRTVAVVSVLNITDSTGSVSADGLVEIDARVTDRLSETFYDADAVELSFDDGSPEHAEAWERFIDTRWDGATCEADVVHVRSTEVVIELNLQ